MDRNPAKRERVLGAGYLLVVLLLVLAARAGLFPGTGEAGGPSLLEHPYRLSMTVAVAILALLLGALSGWIGTGRASLVWGIGVLVTGGLVTGLALSFNPWVLFPSDQYPVTFGWLVFGAPLAFVVWLVSTTLLRRQGAPSAP